MTYQNNHTQTLKNKELNLFNSMNIDNISMSTKSSIQHVLFSSICQSSSGLKKGLYITILSSISTLVRCRVWAAKINNNKINMLLASWDLTLQHLYILQVDNMYHVNTLWEVEPQTWSMSVPIMVTQFKYLSNENCLVCYS